MSTPDDQVMALQEAYANVYNQIVKPDKVFVATQYFRTRWIPLLGTSLAWLIIALRQHCYWNRQTGEKRDWCLVTQEELAQEIGVSVSTVKRLLEQEHADKFIIEVNKRYRYDSDLRKRVRRKSLYRIRMDDPLVPEDEQRLKDLLNQELSGLDIDRETGQIDVLRVLQRLTETSEKEEEEIGDVVADLASKMAGLLTGQTTGREEEEEQPFPDAVTVSLKQLKDFQLADDRVLVVWEESFLAVPMMEVAKHDIRRRHGRWWDRARTECYYSVAHALGEGGEEWTEEEEARIERITRLERELQRRYELLGDFSLEEALHQYFSPQFTARILDGKGTEELERIEGWVAYTRSAKGLINPGGFLRTKIESDEEPPPPQA